MKDERGAPLMETAAPAVTEKPAEKELFCSSTRSEITGAPGATVSMGRSDLLAVLVLPAASVKEALTDIDSLPTNAPVLAV